MKYPSLILLMLFTPWAAIGQTPTCPWLNVATASEVLRSSANSPMAILTDLSATACDFTYQDPVASRTLKITVEQAKNPDQDLIAYRTQCGTNATALHAIGNEAWMCGPDAKGQMYGEQVIGRVRDNIFTVLLSTSLRNDPSMSREMLAEKARTVAEQVAGSLF
jgi:hypothetical protein